MRKKVTIKAEVKYPKTLTIMAHDPGTAAYGWAVVSAKRQPNGQIEVKVLKNGMCHALVKELKSGSTLRSALHAYLAWASETAVAHKAQFVVAERFMTRGIKGPTIEAVNMMLGTLIVNLGLPCKLMPAGQWKNSVRRAGVELDDWYKWAKVLPHQLDACLMGVYMCSVLYGHKGFDGLDLKKLMKKLVLQIEDTSVERLINRVARR